MIYKILGETKEKEIYKDALSTGIFVEDKNDIECNLVYSKEYKINMLKNKLSQTDYQAIKYAEGLITEEEYALIKAQRQAWRDEINRIEQGE